jgi:hypothetical protein
VPSTPVVGHERLWVSRGYSGHGNVLGLACGELVAKAILARREPELELLDPGRLPKGGFGEIQSVPQGRAARPEVGVLSRARID